jgi:hypothetical protein
LIVTLFAATGPLSPNPIVTIPSASWPLSGLSGLAFSTLSPATVAPSALTPTPYESPVASIVAPCLP